MARALRKAPGVIRRLLHGRAAVRSAPDALRRVVRVCVLILPVSAVPIARAVAAATYAMRTRTP